MKFILLVEKLGKPFLVVVGLILIVGIGVLDFATGYEIAFSLFYLIPISLVSWHVNWRSGLFTSFISAFVWLAADWGSGHPYSHPVIYFWNTIIRFGFFVTVAFLMASLRKALDHETELARTDYLTGAINSRYFFELLQLEINRLQRYQRSFSVAYLDLDNFKTINVQYGHSTGDRILRCVVDCVRIYSRSTDLFARVGGDEFILLLPETNASTVQAAVEKVRNGLLEEMRTEAWPITFSIGVVTCLVAPRSIDDLVRMADQLMYSVKRDGKNAIQYMTYTGAREYN